jgi:hypothetical protein
VKIKKSIEKGFKTQHTSHNSATPTIVQKFQHLANIQLPYRL